MGFPYNELCHILKTSLEEEIGNKYPEAFYSDEQDRLFKNAKPGDVFFCYMPLSSEELIDIPEGHRRRPYLIVDKTEDALIGYFCSHKVADSIWKYQSLKLHSNYEFETYVVLKEVSYIKRQHLISKRFELDSNAKAEVNRLIHINLNMSPEYNKNRLVPFKGVNNTILLGSIIKHNDKFYCVHRILTDNIKAYRMYEDNSSQDENLWYIKTETPLRYINAKKEKTFKLDEDINENNLFGALDLNELSQVIKISYIVNKNKTKCKKSYSDFKMYHKPGSIYQFRYAGNDDFFVYLFSRKGNDYVSSLEDCENGYFKIQTVKLSNFRKVDQLKKSSLLDLLNEFMISNPSYKSIFGSIIRDNF